MQNSKAVAEFILHAKESVNIQPQLAETLKQISVESSGDQKTGLAYLVNHPKELKELFKLVKANHVLRDAIGEAFVTTNNEGWNTLHYFAASGLTGLPFVILQTHGNKGLYSSLANALKQKSNNGETPVILMKKTLSKSDLREIQGNIAQAVKNDHDLLRILKEAGVFEGAEKELHHLGVF